MDKPWAAESHVSYPPPFLPPLCPENSVWVLVITGDEIRARFPDEAQPHTPAAGVQSRQRIWTTSACHALVLRKTGKERTANPARLPMEPFLPVLEKGRGQFCRPLVITIPFKKTEDDVTRRLQLQDG